MKIIQKTQSILKKSIRGFKKASPLILSCVAVVGVAATAVTAAQAASKAGRLLKAAEAKQGAPLDKLETVRVAAPSYLPAALIGVSTIACIMGANVLNKRQQAALASGYALLNQSYQRYRKSANSVYGTDADAKITSHMAKETYISADGCALYPPEQDRSSRKVLFHDTFSGRYFSATIPAVLNAQYHLNRNLTLRGDATVNEFYEFLGIDKIDGGDEIGWEVEELIENGIMWLDFENFYTRMDDNMECCIISACVDPAPLGCYVPF